MGNPCEWTLKNKRFFCLFWHSKVAHNSAKRLRLVEEEEEEKKAAAPIKLMCLGGGERVLNEMGSCCRYSSASKS